jgi:hypothetical protein
LTCLPYLGMIGDKFKVIFYYIALLDLVLP